MKLANLSTKVDVDMLNRFKQLVVKKHCKLKGRIGEELTEAMKLYIEKNKKGE